MAEAVAGPVISSGCVVEFGYQDRDPGPPCSLEADDKPKGRPSTSLEWDFCAIYPGLGLVSVKLSAKAWRKDTPRRLPAMTATIPERKDPSARALTENHTVK